MEDQSAKKQKILVKRNQEEEPNLGSLQLTEFPQELYNLNWITILYLCINKCTNVVPDALANELAYPKSLNLNNNSLFDLFLNITQPGNFISHNMRAHDSKYGNNPKRFPATHV